MPPSLKSGGATSPPGSATYDVTVHHKLAASDMLCKMFAV